MLYGGVVYVENTNVTINSSYFLSNSASGEDGQGGVIYTFCNVQSTSVWETNIYNSTFELNSATSEGGVLKYNLFEPFVFDSKFDGNTAGYGTDIASFPLQLLLINENSDRITQNNTSSLYFTKSGETISSPVYAGIYDQYRIIAIQDVAYGFINLTTNNPASASISKNTVSQPTSGIMTFDDFILSAPPSSTVELQITYEDIEINKLDILGYNTDLGEYLICYFC